MSRSEVASSAPQIRPSAFCLEHPRRQAWDVFPLVVELLIVPLLLLFIGMQVVAEHEPNMAQARRVINGVLGGDRGWVDALRSGQGAR
jgi:hypothetical protein